MSMASVDERRDGGRAVEAAAITAHVRAHAGGYLLASSGAAAEVRLRESIHRPHSSIYRFDVSVDGDRHFLLVKTRRSSSRRAGVTASNGARARPRLIPELTPVEKARLEHAALFAVHACFARLGDPRLGAVRVFDLVPEHSAIVMEDAREPSLLEMLRPSRPQHRAADPGELGRVMTHAGEWLRAFHSIEAPAAPDAPAPGRADLLRFVADTSAFLGRHGEDRAFLRWLEAAMEEAALDVLPETPPSALGHCDYGPPNLLVGTGGRVSGIDTMGAWRKPIYEDMGYFLASFKRSSAWWLRPYLGRNARTTAAHERAFLAGYFGGEPVPWRAIRLYEVQATLDKWASIVSAGTGSPAGRWHPLRAAKLATTSWLARRSIRRALARGAEPAP